VSGSISSSQSIGTHYRLAQDKAHPHNDFINQVVNFMDEKLITDDDLEKLIKTVMSIPHKHHLLFPNRVWERLHRRSASSA